MITKNNFKDLLKTLDFTEEGGIFQKSIGDATLQVDFGKQRLIYPEDRGLKVNRQDPCNFSHPENFVVFECVHRLLKKGYKPEHLELEPTWQVGRGASGGRADILVRDHEKNPLLIIECKTAGDEFDRAWRKTQQDGDQLFSYAQQVRRTQYLCLYASDFVENRIRIDQRIIAHRDDENILAQDETAQSFAEAADVEDRYTVWRETYQLEYAESGIFEDNVQAYQIGKNKHTLAEDTKIIDAVDKEGKYHDFRTILRKHNIARRENAFEVLVNLFLSKLVDEEENQNDLQFYWKGMTYDNYFDFVDRLQNLYQKGMRKFLNEEISYISNEQIDNAFWTVKNRRNATKQQIQRYFRELKFFSNSAFSFLDTHNEALFKRNTKVLSEVVQMWQGLRLKAETPNQFLGDMFEMFLDDGVKQSEGQFFTPLPICKFIVAALPLAQKISENAEPLNTIDYACGSGHFLNEYAHQIKPLVEASDRNLTDYYSQITGIEKEDRLAKVAKVAAYMHGQQQIKILDADALASYPEIRREGYDVLIANPPFAVEGFLQTLNDTDKKEYQLIQATGEKSNTNNIECFFLERMHHLMATSGVIGVIVPSSILSNTEAVHNRTREILLQFFDIVSITELGSSTFGKTGTNTVVLFLKRKTQRPEAAEHYRNRVTDFFEGDNQNEEYQDENLIKAYCKHIEIPYQEYIKLFAQTSLDPLSDLLEYDTFKDYKQAFSQSTKIKNLKKSRTYKQKTAEEQSEALTQHLIAYLQKIEKEKIYYFILAHEQENKVLIVNAPSTKKEQKQFLGYAWSEAKGREGIKYAGNAKTVNDIVTPLFDPKNLDDTLKINTAIKNNFIGETTDPLPEYCHYAKLTDMLNFSGVDFDKIISLNPKQNIDIQTKWDLVKLGDVVETQYGYTAKAEDEGDVRYLRITDITEDGQLKNTDKKYINPSEEILKDYNLKPNDIVIARSGSTGRMLLYKGIEEHLIFASYLVRLKASEKILPEYIFAYHKTTDYWKQVDALTTTLAQPNLNAERMKQIKIPLPPLEEQRKIVDECEVVDQETNQARQAITTAKQKIEEKLQMVENADYEMKKLEDIAEKLVAGGDVPKENFSQVKTDEFNIPIFANGVKDKGLYGYTDIAKIEKPSITISARGTLGYTEVRNEKFYPIVRLIVLTPNVDLTDIFYLKHIIGRLDFTDSGSVIPQLTVPKVRSLQIPVPPLDIQQRFAAEVEQLEAKIAQAQAVIDKATERKNVILAKYL